MQVRHLFFVTILVTQGVACGNAAPLPNPLVSQDGGDAPEDASSTTYPSPPGSASVPHKATDPAPVYGYKKCHGTYCSGYVAPSKDALQVEWHDTE